MRRELDELLRLMEQDLLRSQEIWGRFSNLCSSSPRFWQPRADVCETATALIVKVEIAGVVSESLDLELAEQDGALIIRGRREAPDARSPERTVFHQMEIYVGPFERSIPLPANIAIDRDAIQAVYLDGILVVRLPKKPSAASEPNTRIPLSE